MGIEQFPEIESFQKLPRRVIVKGGSSRFDPAEGAELRGIVINNTGHTIQEVSVNLVVFDEREMPLFNTSIAPDPAILPQGAIGSFLFRLKNVQSEIKKYYLYPSWKYDDKE
ncbi:MAG: hypothetical protein HY447_01900 [Candidatus Omnitrophica bacterium]|nr:hypothetical protein [Candidatus Omnitrophota bacterium]